MTRPAVDPATLSGASPAPTNLWHGGVRYLVNSVLYEPDLYAPKFPDKTEALQYVLRLTEAANEAQDRLMVLVGQHRHSRDHARRRLRGRGFYGFYRPGIGE